MDLTPMAHLVLLCAGPEARDMRPPGVKAMPSGPMARGLVNPCPGPAWTAAQPGVAAEFAVSPAGAAGAEKPPCQRPPPGHRIPAWGAERGPCGHILAQDPKNSTGAEGKGPVGPSASPRSLVA